MNSISVFCTFFSLWFTITSAGVISNQEDGDAENFRKLALANNELAFNLHRRLVSGSSKNVFFSPFSISTAFGMLFYGTRGNAAEELREALGYQRADLPSTQVHEAFNRYLREVLKDRDSSDEYALNTANAVLVDKHLGLLEEYRRNVQELYKADVRDVDFKKDASKIVKEVNDFVRKNTNGKIDKLFDELSPSAVLILLNAVYFKGSWKTQFDPKKTRDEMFFNNGLKSEGRKVPVMRLRSKFPHAYVDNFQALELPYKGENVSMLILLPYKIDGLEDLEQSLTPEKLDEIQRRLNRMEVEVSLPKFNLQFERELTPEFQALGANQIFRAGADFSGIASQKNLKVSKIVHKAVIEVNEEGSEAAAVTGMEVVAYSGPRRFRVDHPFLFAIMEKGSKSNMVLFLGRVNNL